MVAVRKILLLLELAIGFGYLLYFWLIGVIFSPAIAWSLFGGNTEAFLPLVAIYLGAVGFWGLLQLALKVFLPTTKVLSPGWLRVSIASGYMAILITVFGFDLPSGTNNSSHIYPLVVLPLLVATHFVYLGRSYLWQSS